MKSIVSACLFVICLFPLFVQGQNCQLNISGTVKEPSCQGGMDASISLQLSGGVAPYTYYWHTGQETASISGLTEGTYKVSVQDAEGCRATATFTFKAPEKDLGLQVKQQTVAGGKVLEVRFAGNKQPKAIYIKDLSKGIRAPQTAYNGQVLTSGSYLLEAFTAAGCSVLERLQIEKN